MRKLLHRVLGREERSALPFCPPGAFGLHNVMGYINPERASQHVVIHRCVQLIAESLSLVPCRIYRLTGTDGREPAKDQPLYTVLQDQFNPNLNAFEGREWLIASVLITGNGYAKKEYNNAGQVTALYPMIPGSVCVERLPNGKLRYNWSRPDGGSEILLQEEMLHIRYRTKDGYIGISPIHHAMPHMGLALTQLDQATAQTEKAFQAPGALVTPQLLTPDQRQGLLEKFRERFIGALKAGEPMVLDGGFKWEGFSAPNKDAEFIDSRKLSNLDLCRIYGVPPLR